MRIGRTVRKRHEGSRRRAHRLQTCRRLRGVDSLGDSHELVGIHNPVAKLDHVNREIVAAGFYEIPTEAVMTAGSKG
jgi:hypothetical protein